MEHRYTNKLINEKSPYLLQHAHNPVDWYPWGEKAFQKAREEDKPIFLSIGYSTCHWCHVMERQCFEDVEVAEYLKEHFISIKVDREERPDIDTIYMSVCQAMTGHGGWPLTIIMSPDRKPFFAGTYFPKHTMRGMAGLMEILDQVKNLWQTDRQKLLKSGEKITKYLQDDFFEHKKGQIDAEVLDKAYTYYHQTYDSAYGGFGDAPKFPTPHNLLFLLRYWKLTGKDRALAMVEKTLEYMYRGGIYDHIGFGFARYSTDPQWLVPHFEKMLYDNALLAIAYLETYQATERTFYARVAEEIFTYVLRDMTSPEGAFYSAEDADSEGEEGKFYLWSPEEVTEVLGTKRGSEFSHAFDITTKGNFEGRSIPNLIDRGLVDGLGEERQKLFTKREQRIHPFKDDKVLTSWNGLMIAALAIGARVLWEEKYTKAAEKAVDFITHKLRKEDGRLLARYRDGESAYLAYAEDYAYLIWGLIELYQTTYKAQYLALALDLNQDLLEYFWDKEKGGLFHYGHDAEQLITRPKEIYDGAIPSANSVAALNFIRLAGLTGDETLTNLTQQQMQAFGGAIKETPPGHSFFLMAAYLKETPATEVTIVGDPEKADTKEMLTILTRDFRPELLVTIKQSGTTGEKLAQLVPIIKDRNAVDGKATAYVCQNYACKPPVTDPKELEALLKQKQKIPIS